MKLNTEEFIKRAKKIHNDKYDYNLVTYINMHIKVKIVCKEHGIFEQIPMHHLNGVNCPKCSGKLILNKYDFLKKANIVHNYKYDYSLVEYINNRTKIKIICPTHGEFDQTSYIHLYRKCGCPKCVGKKLTNDELIEKFNNKHKNKYDYSLVNYTNVKNKLIIICPIHGEFKQTASMHFKCGCPKCVGKFRTNQDIINDFKKIHSDKYDYSLVEYKKANIKVIILCSKHGKFEQTPNSHLNGNGCPYCNESKGEKIINDYLISNDITFERQKTFKKCKNIFELPFDFYLPKHNLCIEYDGEQHFNKMRFEKNNKNFIKRKKRDIIKTTFCKENGIKLCRITYKDKIENKLNEILKIYGC